MRLILLASVLQFLGVALGALGAHGIRQILESTGHMDSWRTAVIYHLIHGATLFALGIWSCADSKNGGASAVRFASGLFVAGILAFSGSLYALSLGAPHWLGPVTPVGGLCFLAGWSVLGVFAARAANRCQPSA